MLDNKELRFIAGYDNNGTIYDAGENILRKINPDYFVNVIELYKKYKDFNLKQIDI